MYFDGVDTTADRQGGTIARGKGGLARKEKEKEREKEKKEEKKRKKEGAMYWRYTLLIFDGVDTTADRHGGTDCQRKGRGLAKQKQKNEEERCSADFFF
ncbi:hypothetical protein FACS189472_17340 [Alphaproteobacteria bacterium]|nr:hypothetical protein FACS189472_17340 [Alphaproteobacteria bacterium]